MRMRNDGILGRWAVIDLSRSFIDLAYRHVNKNVTYIILSFFADVSVDFD